MKTNIWIMNHYASGMYFDHGGRHYNFAKYLRRAGYKPVVFGANSKHGKAERFFETDALWEEHFAEEIDTPFVFVRARTYTGNGKQRVLNMIDFYRNVKKATKEYAAQHGRPDVIFASSVHPLTLVAGIQLAKQFGVKCVCEVRDLWPESIVSFGIAGPHNPAVLALRRLEKWIYKKADALVFTMEGAYDYIMEQGWENDIPRSKVYHINNGVDLESFDYNKEHFRIEDPDLDDPDTFKVVYTGSIRKANGLGILVDAAKAIRDPRSKILVWGEGDEREELTRRVEEEGLTNIIFKGKVEKKYVPAIVSRADLNLIHWGEVHMIQYGVSYNKLFDYMAAGRPIFSTVRPGYSIWEKYDCGRDTEDSRPEPLAHELGKMAALPPEELSRLGRNARKGAEDYDFRVLTQKLLNVIGEIE
jgi:glycosyltransferase involved in cell wall biosynthesis